MTRPIADRAAWFDHQRFAVDVEAYRTRHGISKEALAVQSGMATQSVVRLINEGSCGLSVAVAVAYVCDVALDSYITAPPDADTKPDVWTARELLELDIDQLKAACVAIGWSQAHDPMVHMMRRALVGKPKP